MRVTLKDRIRFALEGWLLGGLGHRLLFAAAIVLGVAVGAGLLLSTVDPEFTPDAAIWWAFLRLTDPGYLGDDQGVARRIIATVVTVLGYLLFLGLLIAILTQWLDDMIERLEAGVTPVGMSDHVLVLGWSQRTPTIVRHLLETRNRVARFLARHGASQLRIVVLAESVDAEISRELRERVGAAWDDRQVTLRAGSPLRLDHLERVAFAEAAVIIVPRGDDRDAPLRILDAETVKTLRALAVHGHGGPAELPAVVAELGSGQSAPVARSAYAGRCETIAADEIVGHLIAQSVIQHGVFHVLRELLTLNTGNAIFVRRFEGDRATDIDELRRDVERAIPIGFVRAGEREPCLNPPGDVPIQPSDTVVYVARHHEDCTLKPSDRPLVHHVGRTLSVPEADETCRILILGWSRKVPALLYELARYGSEVFDVHIVSSKPIEEREQTLEAYGATMARERVRHSQLSTIAISTLNALEPEHYDHIIMMASEQLDGSDQTDAATVFAHQVLSTRLPDGPDRPHVFIELLGEADLFLFDRDVDDVIVSPSVASYLVSQVALRPELRGIFNHLTEPWGSQIVEHRADSWLACDGAETAFSDIERIAAERGQIALGVHLERDGLQLNPDRDSTWALRPTDHIVTLATFLEPDAPT